MPNICEHVPCKLRFKKKQEMLDRYDQKIKNQKAAVGNFPMFLAHKLNITES